MTIECIAAHLVESESTEFDGLDPSRECLGRLAEKVRTGTAEDEETGAKRASVCKHTQHGEEVGTSLNLIDHDRSPKRRKRGHRLVEPGQTPRILEVEVAGRVRRNDLAR
jgi:hypothetical protein